MITRHHRNTAQSVRFAIAARDGQRTAHPDRTPAYPLLDQQPRTTPSLAELEGMVARRAERIYPNLPRETIARAAHQGAEAVLRGADPRVATFLPDLALREARAIIGLYIALGEQHHLRAVA